MNYQPPTFRNDKFVRAHEVRDALTESYNGRSGRNVHAMNSKFEWTRIMSVKTHRQLVYGRALNTGKWFVIHQWKEL